MIRRRLHIARPGTHPTQPKPATWTRETLAQMVASFEATRQAFRRPVKITHEERRLAVGEIVGLELDGDKLYAQCDVQDWVDWAHEDASLLGRSLEVYAKLVIDGVTHPWVVSGLALLGAQVPAVKNLEPYPLEELLTAADDGEELLTYTCLPEAATAAPETGTNPLPEEPTAPIVANQEDPNLMSELEALRAENARLQRQLAYQAAHKTNQSFVERLVAEGRITPAQRDTGIAELLTACELAEDDSLLTCSQAGEDVPVSVGETLRQFLAAAPVVVPIKELSGKPATHPAGQIGQDEEVIVAAQARKLVAEAVSRGEDLSFSAAVNAVLNGRKS